MKSARIERIKLGCLMLCTATIISSPPAASAQGPEDDPSAFLQLTASDIRAKTNTFVSGVMNFTAAECADF